ncbi:MAG TPA: amidohydrolase family protein [Chloroflexota bacterium]|nr:amidohydrolase family protein [Chloroflexota bacterium]
MRTAIRGARVIDGTGADPSEGATVVVEDGRVAGVWPRGQSGRMDETIDAAGLTLMPGLIDAHVHATFNGIDTLRELMTPPSLSLYRAIRNLAATVDAGVTTVRDAGGSPAGLKLALEEGLFPGPRMKVAITILSQTGGHADPTAPSTCCLRFQLPDIPNSVVDGVEPMRQRVREILRAGADWIKVCSTGGVLSTADAPSASQFTIDELRAAVDEGQAHGDVEVMAHAQGTEGIKNAIKAGCKSIEHGIWLDDEAIEMMVRRNIFLVPTLVAPIQVIRQLEANPGRAPAVFLEKARRVVEDHRASFRRAAEAGIRVAMGTDSGVGPHGQNGEELALMVAAGMQPMDAIVASTRSAAELLKVDSEVGTLEPGRLADLLLVDGNPLEDIRVLQDQDRVVMVMQAGRMLKNRAPERLSTGGRAA